MNTTRISNLESGCTADDDCYFPLACNWPMGFSWSSTVAQRTLLGIVATAGLADECVWATDHPLPLTWDLGVAVATDDMMILSDRGPGATLDAAVVFEKDLSSHGAVKHPAKDIDDPLNTCCIGIDLVNGKHWHPPVEKLWQLIAALVDLSASKRCSPGAVAAYHGLVQWFCLLVRLRHFVFESIYEFSSESRAKGWKQVDCPSGILSELLINAALMPFGSIGMRKPFLPLLGATDASTVFGLGATVSNMEPEELRVVARLSAKAGEHVTLTNGQTSASAPLLLAYVRGLLRSGRRFGHRIVVCSTAESWWERSPKGVPP